MRAKLPPSLASKSRRSCVLYLYGTEILHRNAPAGALTNASTSSAPRSTSDAVQQENLDLTPHVTLLAASNVLAIHGLNAAANDNDFLAGLRRFYRLRVSQ